MSNFNYIIEGENDDETPDLSAPGGLGYQIQEPPGAAPRDAEGYQVTEGNSQFVQRDAVSAPKEGFFNQFLTGLGFAGDESAKEKLDKLVLEDSFIGRAGAMLVEKAIGEDDPLVRNARIAEKYEKWQPRIWAQQEKLGLIGDATSAEYQNEYTKLQDLRKDFADDVNGKYVEPESESETFDFAQFWDAVKENKGVMLGALARGVLADPELLVVPGGWTRTGVQAMKVAKNLGYTGKAAQLAAKTAGQATGAGLLGSGFGAGSEIIDQASDNPDAPINFSKVADMALFGGAVTAPLPIIGTAGMGAVRKVKDVFGQRAIRVIEADANRIYANAIDEDGVPQLNRNAAVEQAVARARLTPEAEAAFRETVPNIDDFIDEDAARVLAAQEALKTGPVAEAKQAVSNALQGVVDGWNNLTQPISSRLRNMGLSHMAAKLNRLDMETMTLLSEKHKTAMDLERLYAQLSESDKAIFKLNALNGTFATVRNRFSDEFNEAFGKVRTMLDDELQQAQDAGLNIPGEDNYFPRNFDYERFAKDNGLETAKAHEVLARAINKKLSLSGSNKLTSKDLVEFPSLIRQNLDEAEIGQAIANSIESGGRLRTAGVPSPSAEKARSVESITPELLAYYKDPIASLSDHINKMTVRIKDREFFGGKNINIQKGIQEGDLGPVTDESMVRGYIQDAVNLERANKNITPAQMDELADVLEARFVGSKRKPKAGVTNLRNILYSATLGNPVAAATQLGDLGAAAYMNGISTAVTDVISRGVRGANNIATRNGKRADFKLEDFGLQSLPEPETMSQTGKILDWSLKLGGFKAMDRLGKETIMNSTWRKLQGIGKMNDQKALRSLRERYGQRLGEEEVQLILDGIRSGDTTNPHVRLAVFSDLTRVQPVSMSEMPAAYLNNPNARIFYMLKTFTLKQIDLMRQEVLNNIVNGVASRDKIAVRDGVLNLGKLAFTIGAANMGVDASKRWIRGEDVELGDTIVSNILRNYGLSQYTLNELAKGEPETFVAKMISPPVGVITNPILEGANRVTGGAWGLDTKGRWIDSFPYGRAVRMLMESQESQGRERPKRERRKVER